MTPGKAIEKMAMVGTWVFLAWVVLVILIMMGRCARMTIAEAKPDKPLQEWTFQDHKWVTFNETGLAHHPNCPCREIP